MFENLSNKLDRAFKVLKGQGRITEINVASTIKEIRRALIDADVSYKVAKEITSKIKDEAMGQNVLISVSPGQLLTKIVADELTELMGGESAEISLDGNPNIILLSGLQGSGKTTFTGKLGRYLTKKGKKTLLVACDVYVAAAVILPPYSLNSYLLLAFILIFIASHAIGQGTVIWVFISEIFPNSLRAKGQSLGTAIHWVFAALITALTPYVINMLGNNPGMIFYFFGFMVILQLIFVLRMMPETKGIALEDMKFN